MVDCASFSLITGGVGFKTWLIVAYVFKFAHQHLLHAVEAFLIWTSLVNFMLPLKSYIYVGEYDREVREDPNMQYILEQGPIIKIIN